MDLLFYPYGDAGERVDFGRGLLFVEAAGRLRYDELFPPQEETDV